MADLGEWWEGETGLPIPLGAILAKKGAVDPVEATRWVRDSVRYAWAQPAASQDYVLAHAQEMEPDVVAQHIALYVNEFTEDLGDEGYAAIRALLGRAAQGRAGAPLRLSSSRATAWISLGDRLGGALVRVPAAPQVGQHLRLQYLDHVFDQAVQLLGRAATQLGHRRRRVQQLDRQRLVALAALDHAEVDPLTGLQVLHARRAARPCGRRRLRRRRG